MNKFRKGMTLQEKLRDMETRPREEQVLINEAYLAAQEEWGATCMMLQRRIGWLVRHLGEISAKCPLENCPPDGVNLGYCADSNCAQCWADACLDAIPPEWIEDVQQDVEEAKEGKTCPQ
jgi:hypothetical protein